MQHTNLCSEYCVQCSMSVAELSGFPATFQALPICCIYANVCPKARPYQDMRSGCLAQEIFVLLLGDGLPCLKSMEFLVDKEYMHSIDAPRHSLSTLSTIAKTWLGAATHGSMTM
jgi:hypothetical protein